MRDVHGSLQFLRTLWNDTPKPERHPADLARHQLIIDEVQPAVVVETGLHWGFGARWFADRVQWVVTVERDAQMLYDWRSDTHGFGAPPRNVVVIDGDSLARFDAVEEFVKVLANDRPVLVVLDSDHSANHVHAEMERYGALVTPGSYMVVEDGIYHYLDPGPRHEGNWYDGDPVEAVKKFMKNHDEWELDDELEDVFPQTLNPSGYLRRA